MFNYKTHRNNLDNLDRVISLWLCVSENLYFYTTCNFYHITLSIEYKTIHGMYGSGVSFVSIQDSNYEIYIHW